MTILITGASGFVGRSTVEAALPATSVRAVIRTGTCPLGAKSVRIKSLESIDWQPVLQDVQAVIHLAARVHVLREKAADPLAEYRRVNVDGTRRLAEAAARVGVSRFVFVSSVAVHGDGTKGEVLRPDSPFRPINPYGRSKAEAEDVLRRIEDITGLEVTVIRPPLVYGPGVPAKFLQLMRLVYRGIPLPLGRVRNRRSLVSVRSLSDLLIHCTVTASASGGTFLVSDGDPVSTPGLIRSIATSLGRSARLLPVPTSFLKVAARAIGQTDRLKGLLDSLEVDDSVLRNRLGWKPPVSFEEGLAETAEWFQSQRSD